MTTSDSISFAHATFYSVDTRIANTAEQRPGAGGFTFSDTPRLTVELRVGNEAAFHWLHEQWNARLFRYCFILAGAEFLAIIQVLVYVGAVSVVILFGIMLTRRTLPGGYYD